MSFEELVNIVSKILLIPHYYDLGEKQSNVGLTVLAVAAGIAIPQIVKINTLSNILILVSGVALAVIYWFVLYEQAGIFYWQTAVRSISILLIIIFISKLFKSD